MDEKPDQIIGHIEAQRDQLGRNLNELENRVRENADWHTWFDRNPMMVMGAALGGGLIVGSMIGGQTSKLRRHRKHSSSSRMTGDIVGSASAGIAASSLYSSESPASEHKQEYTAGDSQRQARPSRVKSAVSSLTHSQSWHQVTDTMDDIKAALIAFGVAKAREFLTQSIPGFDQHLDDAQQKRQGRTGHHQEHGSSRHSETEHGGAQSFGTDDKPTHGQQTSGEIGRHLYTPSGEQIVRSGSYSSDPVGTYTP